MRGLYQFNFPAFDLARDQLKREGWDVVSPADLDRENGFDETGFSDDYDWRDLDFIGFDLRAAARRDLKELIECDSIYMLRGWHNSKGATAELAVAEWLGLDVIFQDRSHEEREESKEDQDVLEEALEITKGDRQASYGPPDQDFRRTAKMWEAILEPYIFVCPDAGELTLEIPPKVVAMCMIALKISRETHQDKRDNWVDIAGYARCGSLCR